MAVFFVPRLKGGAIEFATVCLSHFLYHAPGVAPFAKNTIILLRRGTLELCVHWLLLILYRYSL